MKLKTIVIDDSPLQLMATSKLVSNHSSLMLVGNYLDPEKGMEALNNSDVDLVFIDVEMPHISGFELICLIPEKVEVIIISTKHEFALLAFDFGVTDFLLKPNKGDRFHRAIAKALANIVATAPKNHYIQTPDEMIKLSA